MSEVKLSRAAEAARTMAKQFRAGARTDHSPTNAEQGVMFLHCGKCLDEKPEAQSPAQYARLSVSWTAIGLQVWCERHNCNVMHVDFEGYKHPANSTVPADEQSPPGEEKKALH